MDWLDLIAKRTGPMARKSASRRCGSAMIQGDDESVDLDLIDGSDIVPLTADDIDDIEQDAVVALMEVDSLPSEDDATLWLWRQVDKSVLYLRRNRSPLSLSDDFDCEDRHLANLDRAESLIHRLPKSLHAVATTESESEYEWRNEGQFGQSGWAPVSVKVRAESAGLSERTYKRHLAKLRQWGADRGRHRQWATCQRGVVEYSVDSLDADRYWGHTVPGKAAATPPAAEAIADDNPYHWDNERSDEAFSKLNQKAEHVHGKGGFSSLTLADWIMRKPFDDPPAPDRPTFGELKALADYWGAGNDRASTFAHIAVGYGFDR